MESRGGRWSVRIGLGVKVVTGSFLPEMVCCLQLACRPPFSVGVHKSCSTCTKMEVVHL